MARIVESSKGGQILEHDGFRYQKRRCNRNQTKIYWRCEERDLCNATMTTNFNVHNGIILQRGKPHTHEANQVHVNVQSIVRAVK